MPAPTPPKRFTGTWTVHFPSGRIAEEAEYRNGKLHGKRVLRFDNAENSLKHEQHFLNDQRHGECRAWNENQQLRSTVSWKNGEPDGPVIDWHPNGAKEREEFYEDGVNTRDTQRWDEDGNLVAIERYIDGNRTTIEYYEKESLKRIDVYNRIGDLHTIQHIEDGKIVRATDPHAPPEFSCDVQILGAWSVTPTLESIAAAARYHRCEYLLNAKGRFKEKIYPENHHNLRLIEVQILGEFSPQELLSSISLSDQAPYMEFFLDAAGENLLSTDDAVTTPERRLCFFLHFVTGRKPLEIVGRKLKLPRKIQLPDRLIEFTHYLPVD